MPTRKTKMIRISTVSTDIGDALPTIMSATEMDIGFDKFPDTKTIPVHNSSGEFEESLSDLGRALGLTDKDLKSEKEKHERMRTTIIIDEKDNCDEENKSEE